jgi:hypothetical protein
LDNTMSSMPVPSFVLLFTFSCVSAYPNRATYI